MNPGTNRLWGFLMKVSMSCRPKSEYLLDYLLKVFNHLRSSANSIVDLTSTIFFATITSFVLSPILPVITRTSLASLVCSIKIFADLSICFRYY